MYNLCLIAKFLSKLIFLVIITNQVQFAPNWNFDLKIKDSNIELKFTSNSLGWMGIGFGSRHMLDTDMVVVIFKNNTNFVIKDTFSKGNDFPIDDDILGGTQDYKNCIYEIKNQNFTLSCERKINTTDKYDYQFTYPSEVEYSFAWGDIYSNHQKKKGSSKFWIDSQGKIVFDQLKKNKWFYKKKALILLVFWCCFNFFGILSSKYFKHYSSWIIFHTILSGGASLMNVFLGIYSLTIASIKQKNWLKQYHYYLGVLLVLLSLFEILMGTLMYCFKKRKLFKTNIRSLHKKLGYILTCLSLIELGIGMKMGFNDFLYCFINYLILYQIGVVTFKIFSELKEKNKVLMIYSLDILKYNQELEIYDKKKLQSTNKKIVFLDNYVVNIDDFISRHPGGMFHLQFSLNQDISRYVSANTSTKYEFSPHEHLFPSLKLIYDSLIIGVYNDHHKIVKVNNCRLKSQPPNFIIEFSKVNFQRKVAKNTAEFRFYPQNKSVVFSKFLKGYVWIGKSFSVSSVDLNQTRIYSVCLCLSEKIYRKHKMLIENIENIENSKPNWSLTIEDNESLSDYLELYIKKYDEGKLSKYIHEKNNIEVIVKGPIGKGLDLDETLLSGTFIAFSAGTGVFCFADFIAFTLRYMCYRIKKNNQKFEKLEMISEDEDFSMVSNDFKLIYFSAFQDDESAIFNDICYEMVKIDKKFELNIFTFYSRISSGNLQKFDVKFIKNHLSEERNINKVFLCGTLKFQDDVRISLHESGLVSQSQIHLV